MKNNKLNTLKKEIGFGTAFRATLGFYAAQAAITVAILAVFAVFVIFVF